ncbi:hypothetical protein H2204_005939 [Knufia peltigerae]|uniref:MATE efflux family protein n=1 Tax=Knufia peltigerae TaxID=1002370 RepID=A0AA39CZE5_9EURO|nr:hypothetical protein H2204_005939 [Knufia peltigerae]
MRPITSSDTESTYLLEHSDSTEKQATWSSELKVLSGGSCSLIVANILQLSLNISSMLVISARGKIEFGAVSVATTTANITGFIVFQGLATSLDTLCAQAWGSGKPHLARLHVQRMISLLAVAGIPIAVLWWNSGRLLPLLLPEPQTAMFAGLYLKVLTAGIPGFVVFEAAKRILTAEGTFLPVTGILCAGACTNGLFGWILVWVSHLKIFFPIKIGVLTLKHSFKRYNLGFIGAPIAVAATWTLIPLYLLLYLGAVGKGGIWPDKPSRVFVNWGPMLRLAIPGLIMVEAEYLAFEVLVIASAQLSTASLAAQTILATLNSIFWQIPFSISIAGATRIAQHIGARSATSARTSAIVALVFTLICSSTNGTLMFAFRAFWPTIFSDDQDVIELVETALPLVAVMQVFDGLVACCNGVLRAIGRPSVGGWVNLSSYYIVALPLSLWSSFVLHWGLRGLWVGVTVALLIVTMAELVFLSLTDWKKSVEDAEWRNNRPLDQEL